MATFYERVSVDLPTWQLPTAQPLVVAAQLTGHYPRISADDGRAKRRFRDEDRRRFHAGLDAARELGADFLVFPEYTCPLSEAATALKRLEASLPDGSVCILPFEHLTLAEYDSLLRELPGSNDFLRECADELHDSVPSSRRSTAIVNVTVSVVHTRDGLYSVPQNKLRPAAFEEPHALGRWQQFGGRRRHVVRGQNCSFAVVVCFDLIARDEAHEATVRHALAEGRPDILFGVECNPSPFNENYSQAIIDLFQEPEWRRSPPAVVLVNAAINTVLPSDPGSSSFGFSRIVGRLGSASSPRRYIAAVTRNEILEASPPLRSLGALEAAARRLHLRNIDSIVIRPHESLWTVRLPTVQTGPSADPTQGRTNTEFDVARYVGLERTPWMSVHSLFELPLVQSSTGVPKDLVNEGGLIGVRDVTAQFIELFHSTSKPIWVVGDGGIGKTALVADTLLKVEQQGTAIVIWMEMASVGPTETDFVEELLLLLGKARALAESPDVQWSIVEKIFSKEHRILVLNDFDRWAGGPNLPARASRLARYPSRLIVTARTASDDPSSVETQELTGLDFDSTEALLSRLCGRKIDREMAAALYNDMKGSPLSCVWAAGVIRAASNAPSELGNLLEALEGNQITSLQQLFDLSIRHLGGPDRQVLAALCELPAPIINEDISIIVGQPVEQVRLAVAHLRQANLTTSHPHGPHGVGLHTRHPFVQQFFATGNYGHDPWVGIVRWVGDALMKWGGDANWPGRRELEPRWTNVRYVLERLSASPEASDLKLFLQFWRDVDYFLWSSGRWRERIRFGSLAATIARRVGHASHLAHALFDSIAETEWHRRSNLKQVEPLLDEAAGIYDSLADSVGASRVEYYRSRVYRNEDRLEDAISAAQRAIELGNRVADLDAIAFGHHALANAYRSLRRFDEARVSYAKALLRFSTNNVEMEAVVRRGIGQIEAEEGKYAEALIELETAFDRFVDLDLHAEAAEAGLHHAVVLARLGEVEEGRTELENMAQALDRLGSEVRRRDVQRAQREIEGMH